MKIKKRKIKGGKVSGGEISQCRKQKTKKTYKPSKHQPLEEQGKKLRRNQSRKRKRKNKGCQETQHRMERGVMKRKGKYGIRRAVTQTYINSK